jgi:hypothetical protein
MLIKFMKDRGDAVAAERAVQEEKLRQLNEEVSKNPLLQGKKTKKQSGLPARFHAHLSVDSLFAPAHHLLVVDGVDFQRFAQSANHSISCCR